MIVDLFAGPGGWDEGMRSIGVSDVVGIEWDEAACRTREAAGHRTIRADVAAFDPETFRGARGVIASPPCPPFSLAGSGDGRKEFDKIGAAIEACRGGWVDEARAGPWKDERTVLVLEPLRWVWAVRPTWVACEQVPLAVRIWEHMADVLRAWGYGATAVVLNAADYGVPQTRERAFLLARRGGGVRVPDPTHARDPLPSLFGPSRRRWVTMAEALGWGISDEPSGTVRCHPATPLIGGSGAKEKYDRAQRDGRWVLRMGNQEKATVRAPDEPAPTLLFGHRVNDVEWVFRRPPTTVQGTDRIGRPGHKDRRKGGESQFEREAVRITQEEAAILQGFPAEYPFQGNKGERFGQIGNAVPPGVAAAIVAEMEGIERGEVAA